MARFSHVEPPREKKVASIFSRGGPFFSRGGSPEMHIYALCGGGKIGCLPLLVVQEVQAPTDHARVYIARAKVYPRTKLAYPQLHGLYAADNNGIFLLRVISSARFICSGQQRTFLLRGVRSARFIYSGQQRTFLLRGVRSARYYMQRTTTDFFATRSSSARFICSGQQRTFLQRGVRPSDIIRSGQQRTFCCYTEFVPPDLYAADNNGLMGLSLHL